jgi:hypothetical protein
MNVGKIFSIILPILSGLNLGLLVYIHRRKADLDFRELFLSAREGVNKLQMQTLKSLEAGLNRREKALAEKEKLFSRLLPEEQLERFEDALVDIFAGAFQVPASILRGGLSKEQEEAFERNFNPPSDKANDVKHGPVCLCTAKVKPLDCAIYCDLHKDALESIPGSNGAVRRQANEIACAFLPFISELWENGNHIKEASLYVVFTEDQHET